MLAAVTSDEFLLIKGGLIMFNKLIEVIGGGGGSGEHETLSPLHLMLLQIFRLGNVLVARICCLLRRKANGIQLLFFDLCQRERLL